MWKSTPQAAAERLVTGLLEVQDTNTVEAFAEFAAGEISDRYVALLFSSITRHGIVSIQTDAAIEMIGLELEKTQRPAFIKHHAAKLLEQADISNEVAAEQAYGKGGPL